MDAPTLLALWNEGWNSGLWAGAWSKTVETLTAQQAAWKPATQRKSIWQIIEHMIFWREVILRRAAGETGPADDEIARRNFPEPSAVTDGAFRLLLDRFKASQDAIAAHLGKSGPATDKIPYVIAHDAYHMGQIAYLRAMQNLAPLE
ncbi:MAG: DinB family protein [Phycisphaerales bacterium]|nr:DinB family protein [Phycisphaerales bacterium]